jgi:prolycopene isomerase
MGRRYIIPGGSAGHFQRDGYVLDVGASMMFGMGDVRSLGPKLP